MNWRSIVSAAALIAALPLAAAPRDGSHDFDFNVGTWRSHITRIADPFAAPDKATTFDATVSVRPIWGGHAFLEEIVADGAAPWRGMTLFLYDPAAAQWRQSYAGARDGTLQAPTIGSFAGGVGRLYAQDSFQGRSILVRGEWSHIDRDAHRYEESYSDDGGATWRPVFTANLTRAAK